METQTLKRNSGFELMRIICMLLIVTHHYSVHGGYKSITAESLTSEQVFIQFLALFGRLACSMFAMISGYYMIETTRKNHYRKIIPLVAEMMFYSILIWLIAYFTGIVPTTLESGIKAFFPMLWGNWFIVGYILFYALIPYINPMITALSKKQFTKLIFALLIIWSVIPTFTARVWSFSSIDFFFVMYLLGAYIRLNVAGKVSYNNNFNLLIGLGCAVLLVLSVVAFDFLGVWFNIDFFVVNATYFREYSTIIAVPCAIFLFLYFSNLNFSNKIINSLSKSMLGVYLIHDNAIFRTFIWTIFYPNANYVDSPYLHATAKIIGVFVGCLLIDIIRRATIGYAFDTWFYRHCDSMVDSLKKMIPQKLRDMLEI